MMMLRWFFLSIFLLLPACGQEAGTLGPTDDVLDPDADPDTDPDTDVDTRPDVEPGEPAPPPPGLSTASLAALTDDLDDLVDSASSDLGLHVVDLDNGQVVYTRGADGWRKPASNTKLLSTAVALDHLGRDHRPTVTAWASRAPRDGLVGSDLVVLGQHDGSWSSWLHDSASDPPRRLATALSRGGVRRVAGRLVVSGDFVTEPYRFGTLDAAAQRAAAADAIARALSAAGIRVDGGIELEPGLEPPAGWTRLAIWRGASLEAVTAIINRISHNELADNLARHTGWSLEGRGDYAGHEVVVAAWLADAGLDTSGFVLRDGSGLSHDNRVTPRLVVELLAHIDGLPSRGAFVRSLSVAGYDGTLAGRLTGPDVRGRFLGKTGTLNGVIATSGILHHRYDGHRYAISILANRVPARAPERALHDRIIGRIGQDLRPGSPRPAAPLARSLIVHQDRLVLSLLSDEAATGTEVWRSWDGRVWDRSDASWHTGERIELDLDGTSFVRLIAVGPGGRSEPSDTLVARPESGPRVLLVDGNDRWDTQDAENPLGAGHDFLARLAEALPGVALDSADNDTVLDGDVLLDDYDAVVWALGEESTADDAFDVDEQGIIEDYVVGGGALVVSGSEVGWDLGEKGDAADRAFLEDVLGGRYLADDAGTWIVEPAEAAFVGLADSSFHLPGYLRVNYADVLEPGPDARVSLAYGSVSGGAAAIRREHAPVLWLGFPVESIDDVADREAILVAALDVLGVR